MRGEGRIRACPYCGSDEIGPKMLFGGPLAGVDNKDGSCVCHACGRTAVPLDFTSLEELERFRKGVLGPMQKEAGEGSFSFVPVLPVDTTALFSLAGVDLPIGQVAEVVSLEWDGHSISRTAYSAPFVKYCRAVEGQRYNASDILLMDLSGIRSGRPNFRVLRELIKRKYNVWLDLGIRSVQDLFDSFAMEISRAVATTLTSPGMRLFEEIFELSDRCLPCLCVDKRVIWARPNGGPSRLSEVARELRSTGYEEVAVVDLRRLGTRGGISEAFLSETSALDMRVFVGGGVVETDLDKIQESGVAGAFIDPHTPVISDLLSTNERLAPTDFPEGAARRAARPTAAPTD